MKQLTLRLLLLLVSLYLCSSYERSHPQKESNPAWENGRGGSHSRYNSNDSTRRHDTKGVPGITRHGGASSIRHSYPATPSRYTASWVMPRKTSMNPRTRDGWREVTSPKSAARTTSHKYPQSEAHSNVNDKPDYTRLYNLKKARHSSDRYLQSLPDSNHETNTYKSHQKRLYDFKRPINEPQHRSSKLQALKDQKRFKYPSSRSRAPDWSNVDREPHYRHPFQSPHSQSESIPSPEGLHGPRGRWTPLNLTQKKKKDTRPNIILIISDDQDVELGSLNYMPRLMQRMGAEGTHFTQAYTSTPMCCPSRSSMLTGMYIHNHEVYTNNDNCSSPHWQATHERRTFATYLNDAGYRTGYFGKYLNKYNGSHVPPGWREWAGLIMNSRYYNYTLNRNNRKQKYGYKYPQDYFPHVITNDGLHFLRTSVRMDPPPPIMMTLSYPGPHGPEDSAPEHSHKFFNASDHHTPSYNYAPNPDKQWMLQYTDKMQDIHLKFTDLLMTKRLQTLQTIDEAVEKIIAELTALDILDNTYIFYTSDHGYHLGQFGLVKGKSFPFEFDIKVPFLVRGPGIVSGSRVNKIALNIDLAPTFLDIAGVSQPKHMDGRSLLPLLKQQNLTNVNHVDDLQWRDSFLVESSGRHREEGLLEMKEQKRWRREHELSITGNDNKADNVQVESPLSNLYTSKHEQLEKVCKQKHVQPPCKHNQKWQCVHDGRRWRLQKCRVRSLKPRRNCVCEPDLGMGYIFKLNSNERKKQRDFLKRKYDRRGNIITEDDMMNHKRRRISRWFTTIHDRPRNRRSADLLDNFSSNIDDTISDFVEEEELKDIDDQIFELSDELEDLESARATSAPSTPTNISDILNSNGECTADDTSLCNRTAYLDKESWKIRKSAIVEQIQLLRKQLMLMKNIRKHVLEATPPVDMIEDGFNDYEDVQEEVETDSSGDGISDEEEDYYLNNNTVVWTRLNNEENITQIEAENERELSSLDPNISNEDFSFTGLNEDHYSNRDLKLRFSSDYKKLNNGRTRSSGRRKSNKGSRRHRKRKNEYGLGKHGPLSNKRHRSRFYISDNSENLRGSKSNDFKYEGLYPIRIPAMSDDESLTNDNETTPQPICWCDRRTAAKFTIQAERMKKRLKRQKIKDERLRRRIDKKLRRKKRPHRGVMSECNFTKLNCYTHDNDHWRTPPLWTDGKFCFCMNSANNTYWCLRTINHTANFLFCEFITGLITYYDLNIDPYQLRNVAFTLSNNDLSELHQRLQVLRTCRGAESCDGFKVSGTSDNETDSLTEPTNLDEDNTAASVEHWSTLDTTDQDDNQNVQYIRNKEEKMRIREEKRRLRKEQKRRRKYERGLLNAAVGEFLDSPVTKKQKVRLPRKSRPAKEKKRNRKDRRERKKKARKDRKPKKHRKNKSDVT